MEKHGFLEAYPLLCTRENGHLLVQDGQHRLALAKILGLAVPYVVITGTRAEAVIQDIPVLANTQNTWTLRDYAHMYSARGNNHYKELLDFVETHHLPFGACVAIMADDVWSVAEKPIAKYKAGEFEVTTREKAAEVAGLYNQLREISKNIRGRAFLATLAVLHLVKEFNPERLVRGAKRCPETLKHYGTREGYLVMLEYVYNYGRSKKFPLKISSENAMRKRFSNKSAK